MKPKKIFLSLVLFFALLTLCILPSASLDQTIISPIYEMSAAELNIHLTDVASQVADQFSEEQFGGVYIDENRVIINVVNEVYNKLPNTQSTKNGVIVEYHPVELSLAYLEDIMDQMTPYMMQYKICTIDADDVTNTLDLEVVEKTDELWEFIESYIDPKYVRVSTVSSYPTATVAYGD